MSALSSGALVDASNGQPPKQGPKSQLRFASTTSSALRRTESSCRMYH